jgi:vacuolar-type H+-ATPase subunit E/Vma4
VQQASEEAVQDALGRMKQETAKFPAEIEQTGRATVKKIEEELDQKSSEMQHASHEALLKTSEWYQKKAQTTMHSTMERLVEQSANAMHAKAGEVSSMVASELDHYRRSYVEHSRAEIEEAGNEVTERERLKLNETAEIANATFSDRVQRVTQESLQRFQDSSREALEKSRSDMEFNRECSLAEFQKTLDEKMTHGVEQASTYLQSQLIPLLESWEAKREAEKKEWMAQVKQSSEESLEAYKARLENATNAWLLASAATLGQNSQAVLDNLAKTAEKRMRDTCSQVLSGMGDLLRNRMMGISTDFSEEDESGKK